MTSQDCAVCFETKSIDEFGFLPCSHSFCTFCIQHLRQLICPLCRHPFNEYENNGHPHSAPARTTNLIHEYMSRRPSIDSVDDFYLEDNIVATNRLSDRMRRRLRRRRRRLNSDRPRRRSEEIEETVFQIDDILPPDTTENTQHEEKKEEEHTSRNSNRRRDNWQILRNQRSRYSR